MCFKQLSLTMAFVMGVEAIARDSGVSGPRLELIHEYYDEWPTGVAVSSTGRIFICYPLGLDANNTKFKSPSLSTRPPRHRIPLLSAEINSPPRRTIQLFYNPAGWSCPNSRWHFALSSYGGPKLVGVNLTTNQVFKTITFSEDVAYSTSYLNDVRFDLRSMITGTGEGAAYISDSSFTYNNGIIVVDLDPIFEVTIWGDTVQSQSTGIDGITLSADGEMLYFGVVSGRYIYSVPTARLLDDTSSNAQMKSIAAVNRLVQKGVSDGYEVDSNGYIYVGSFETNSVNVFFPNNLTVSTLVLESGGSLKGYLYFIENQLWKSDREKPYALFRVPLPDGGLKIT
ncbi:uncharacterized protein N7484_002376 [Penicillium longicatenatum]|uniref:uncharacterized protein n=1 Tax=Penicillium longicatenatum TaxID=1561947 RepID=UPI002547F173|nr:uncharacterized protein N7484_002376 [Penicillium longicatenatum]KAJ5658727.1 hypothetical protein N7484_002376 [Penicillium longicatenatum]